VSGAKGRLAIFRSSHNLRVSSGICFNGVFTFNLRIIIMPEITITIKDDNEVSSNNFTDYQDAINFLDAYWNEEIDEKHKQVMSEK